MFDDDQSGAYFLLSTSHYTYPHPSLHPQRCRPTRSRMPPAASLAERKANRDLQSAINKEASKEVQLLVIAHITKDLKTLLPDRPAAYWKVKQGGRTGPGDIYILLWNIRI